MVMTNKIMRKELERFVSSTLKKNYSHMDDGKIFHFDVSVSKMFIDVTVTTAKKNFDYYLMSYIFGSEAALMLNMLTNGGINVCPEVWTEQTESGKKLLKVRFVHHYSFLKKVS